MVSEDAVYTLTEAAQRAFESTLWAYTDLEPSQRKAVAQHLVEDVMGYGPDPGVFAGVRAAALAANDTPPPATYEQIREEWGEEMADAVMCHNGHPFEPGIDIDDPEHPDPTFCNVCGERRRPVPGSAAHTFANYGNPPHVHVFGPSGQCDCGDDRNSYVESEGTDVDDLLASADAYSGSHLPGEWLVRNLASALRSRRDVISEVNGYLAQRQRECDGLRRELAEARAGLEHINRHNCEHYTHGSCLTDPSRSRDAEFGADQWCDPCIAADALGKKENSRG